MLPAVSLALRPPRNAASLATHTGIAVSAATASGADSRNRFRTYGFRNNCYGYACGYGYPLGYGYYDPWLWDWWDSGSTYDQDDPSQDVAAAAEMNRQNLEEQRMLRQEEADGDQDALRAFGSSAAPGHARGR